MHGTDFIGRLLAITSLLHIINLVFPAQPAYASLSVCRADLIKFLSFKTENIWLVEMWHDVPVVLGQLPNGGRTLVRLIQLGHRMAQYHRDDRLLERRMEAGPALRGGVMIKGS
jgi:hypothetical protein